MEISFIIFFSEVFYVGEKRLASHSFAIAITFSILSCETFPFKLFSKISGSRFSVFRNSFDLKYLYITDEMCDRDSFSLLFKSFNATLKAPLLFLSSSDSFLICVNLPNAAGNKNNLIDAK